jgi:hypothetical protein
VVQSLKDTFYMFYVAYNFNGTSTKLAKTWKVQNTSIQRTKMNWSWIISFGSMSNIVPPWQLCFNHF